MAKLKTREFLEAVPARAAVEDNLRHLEESGELLPGSARAIQSDLDFQREFARVDDADHGIELLHERLYGGAARAGMFPGDPVIPARPRSPLVRPDAPSLALDPVTAAIRRTGLIRPSREAELAAELVAHVSLDPGPLAAVVLRHVYENRANHAMLRQKPPAPSYERKVLAVLLEHRQHLADADPGDIERLAEKWGELGTGSPADVERKVLNRLKDPAIAARYCRFGRVPDIAREEGPAPVDPRTVEDTLRGDPVYGV